VLENPVQKSTRAGRSVSNSGPDARLTSVPSMQETTPSQRILDQIDHSMEANARAARHGSEYHIDFYKLGPS
jgi:hypothetical protein